MLYVLLKNQVVIDCYKEKNIYKKVFSIYKEMIYKKIS